MSKSKVKVFRKKKIKTGNVVQSLNAMPSVWERRKQGKIKKKKKKNSEFQNWKLRIEREIDKAWYRKLQLDCESIMEDKELRD